MLLWRNINASDTCHFDPLKPLQLTLPLFVTRVAANHANHAIASNHLAVTANFLNRSRNLHFVLLEFQVLASKTSAPRPGIQSLFRSKNNPRTTQVVGCQLNRHFVTWKNSDVVHPHLSRNMTQDHMIIF
jgi:hypothetical protein